MTTINGIITAYLPLLTRSPEDAAVQEILAQQSGKLKTSTYSSPYAHYKAFPEAGTQFLFDKEGLSAVFFKMSESAAFKEAAFPSEPALIDGLLLPGATMDDVRVALGEPYQNDADYWDVYKADEQQFVHFEYGSEDRVRQVTIMHTVPGDY